MRIDVSKLTLAELTGACEMVPGKQYAVSVRGDRAILMVDE